MIRYQLSLERQFRVAEYEKVKLPDLGEKSVRWEIIKFANLAADNYFALPNLSETRKWDIEMERNSFCVYASDGSQPEGIIKEIAVTAFSGWLKSIELLESVAKEGGT